MKSSAGKTDLEDWKRRKIIEASVSSDSDNVKPNGSLWRSPIQKKGVEIDLLPSSLSMRCGIRADPMDRQLLMEAPGAVERKYRSGCGGVKELERCSKSKVPVMSNGLYANQELESCPKSKGE
ncbi:hypothetical protein L1987_18067 [Smallanthus sonchifolius]|uniref:Uncharacterized protein n=1 Tax=Smallanthus sonchifolius TaxID=185202 RepID=A0ACB9J0W8_9ASTR|nr:hypothetical protein L1987_18067 [Smallanthus sonchifolius]